MASYVTVTIWSIFCDGHRKNNDKKKWGRLAQKRTFLVMTSMKTVTKGSLLAMVFMPLLATVFMLVVAKC